MARVQDACRTRAGRVQDASGVPHRIKPYSVLRRDCNDWRSSSRCLQRVENATRLAAPDRPALLAARP
eukprot:731815-Prymnesium_polylepis.1